MGLWRSLQKRLRRSPPPDGYFYRSGPSCQIDQIGSIYERHFGRRRDGTFVEVGAFDGEANSNTSFLADLGWRGLYVEPVPEFAEACARRHAANPGVRVVNAAAGREPGQIEIRIGRALSTSVAEVADAYRDLDWAQGSLTDRRITAEVRRLDDVLHQAGMAPGFELLVVDVEGAETAVFDGFDLADWRPGMLIVELADNHPDFVNLPTIAGPAARLRVRLRQAGYCEVHRDVINTVLVRA